MEQRNDRSGLSGFVLAAGLGSRIAELSARRPKPLLPVGLTTPLARAVSALRQGGARRIVANAAHLPSQVQEAGRALGIEVSVEEAGPFGTAGGLAAARRHLGDEVVIWNGDIVAELDVASLCAARRSDAVAVLAVRALGERGSGNVGLDREGRVVRLRRQSFGEEARGAFYAAISICCREVVDRAPARGCIIGDLLIPLLAEGARIDSYAYPGPWHDVGDLGSYLAANVAEGSALGAGAVVAPGIELDRVVLGAGSSVEGHGALREVVVFPGAVARAPLSRVIVTGDEIVAVP